MTSSAHSSLLNAALYQLGWLVCVLGAAGGWGTAGASIAFALIALHLALAQRPRLEIPVIAAAAAIGLTADTLHAAFGVLRFGGHEPGALAPLWILALWMQFATALHFCLRWLSKRYLLASALGLIGGPLSFLGGERLGAATFGEPRLAAVAVLGLTWSITLPLLVAVADRFATGGGAYRLPWDSRPKSPGGSPAAAAVDRSCRPC